MTPRSVEGKAHVFFGNEDASDDMVARVGLPLARWRRNDYATFVDHRPAERAAKSTRSQSRPAPSALASVTKAASPRSNERGPVEASQT
jgi:hypothetical protein